MRARLGPAPRSRCVYSGVGSPVPAALAALRVQAQDATRRVRAHAAVCRAALCAYSSRHGPCAVCRRRRATPACRAARSLATAGLQQFVLARCARSDAAARCTALCAHSGVDPSSPPLAVPPHAVPPPASPAFGPRPLRSRLLPRCRGLQGAPAMPPPAAAARRKRPAHPVRRAAPACARRS